MQAATLAIGNDRSLIAFLRHFSPWDFAAPIYCRKPHSQNIKYVVTAPIGSLLQFSEDGERLYVLSVNESKVFLCEVSGANCWTHRQYYPLSGKETADGLGLRRMLFTRQVGDLSVPYLIVSLKWRDDYRSTLKKLFAAREESDRMQFLFIDRGMGLIRSISADDSVRMVTSSLFVDTSRHIISDSPCVATIIRSEVGDTVIASEKVVGLKGESEVVCISDKGVLYSDLQKWKVIGIETVLEQTKDFFSGSAG
jgi:hypothetical protein